MELRIYKTSPFPGNLKFKRKEKKLTQKSISERLRVNRKRYASWEEGRSDPPLFFLIKLTEVLEIDDLYLFLSKDLAKC